MAALGIVKFMTDFVLAFVANVLLMPPIPKATLLLTFPYLPLATSRLVLQVVLYGKSCSLSRMGKLICMVLGYFIAGETQMPK